MRAVVAPRPGGPEALEIQLRPRPVPAEGELLIRVEAGGVNRPDVHQRQGHYPPPVGVTDVLGLEIAGEVAALGPDASVHRLGARVTALVAGGGYADYCIAHETNALPIPAGLTAIEASAIPETYFTVWTNVFGRGALKTGETLLVHGGASGIGTTAITLAKAFGARVVATAGSDEKAAQCERLGADLAVNYRKDDFVPDASLDRRPGRRRHPGYGRRRLCGAQLRCGGAGRTYRANRLSERPKGDRRSQTDHGEASHPRRFDPCVRARRRRRP
jgi:NADPH:quinone reductase